MPGVWKLFAGSQVLIQQPFRILFVIGILGLWFALLLWLPGNTARAYRWHGELMIGLFLLPVASGFLLYTVPRFFSSSNRASAFDVWFSLTACLGMFFAAAMDIYGVYLICKIILLVFLAFFFSRRYPARGNHRPIFAPFLLAGFFLGLSGSIAQLVDYNKFAQTVTDPAMQTGIAEYGRLAFRHGFFWVLFCGLGIRLFPMLTLSVHNPQMPAWRSRLVFNPRVWQVLAWLLAATFVLEALMMSDARRAIQVFRFLISTLIAGEGWLLFKAPRRRGVVPVFVKLALGTALLGQFVLIFANAGQAKHLGHLIFGAGLGIGTLLIVTRMLLSHTSRKLELEVNSVPLGIAFALMYGTALVRACAPWLVAGSWFLPLMAGAAIIWSVATLIWVIRVGFAVRAPRS